MVFFLPFVVEFLHLCPKRKENTRKKERCFASSINYLVEIPTKKLDISAQV
jgi:hypothetical protein